MPLSPEPQKPSCPELELAAFDSLLQTEPKPLLIGGQAVNLWAQVFLKDIPELEELKPFLSKDCDLFGSQELLLQLAQKTKWRMTSSPEGQPSPVTGYLMHTDAQGQSLLVEVLYSVKGLTIEELQREVLVQLGNRTYKTLSPVTLMKAKLANFVELPQNTPGQERNDLKHIRIIIPCVAAYLNQGLDRVRAGVFTERSFVNLLEETLTIGKSDHARRTTQSTGLDFMRCFPASLRTTDLPKVKNFVGYRIAAKPE